MNILITGVAGFVGMSLAEKLLNLDHHIYGIDNLNDYYDIELKKNRLALLNKFSNFNFIKSDIKIRSEMFMEINHLLPSMNLITVISLSLYMLHQKCLTS